MTLVYRDANEASKSIRGMGRDFRSQPPRQNSAFVHMALGHDRDLERAETAEDQEADLYIARHNSIVDLLGLDVDRSIAGSAAFELSKLAKGLFFEVVRRDDRCIQNLYSIFDSVLLSRD